MEEEKKNNNMNGMKKKELNMRKFGCLLGKSVDKESSLETGRMKSTMRAREGPQSKG